MVCSHPTKKRKELSLLFTQMARVGNPRPSGQAKLRLPAADVDAFVIGALQRFLTDNTGLAKLLRAAHVRSSRLAEALQKAEATSRELEDMPFQSRLELVTDLIARIDVMQACLRITFRITGIVRYLSGGENPSQPPGEDAISVDFPMPSIVQNGSVKLVVTQPSQKNEDAPLIAAIARGTCWFEELTSGKASSISVSPPRSASASSPSHRSTPYVSMSAKS